MRDRKQPYPPVHPGEPEHLPSTTRAVAWGAMLFAFIAFLMSSATLFLTYKDGRLVDNFTKLTKELRGAIPKSAEGGAASDDQEAMRSKVRDQLDRYAAMIRSGDKQARYYLEDLRGDLARLQAYGSNDARKWIADAEKTVEAARDQLRDNAPDAAQKLKDLSDRLGGAVRALRPGDSQRPKGAAAKTEDKSPVHEDLGAFQAESPAEARRAQ